MDKGDNALASRSLVKALPVIDQFEPWRAHYARIKLAKGFTRAGDEKNLSRLLKFDESADKANRFSGHDFLRIGQRKRAAARFEQEVNDALGELESETLNAHFPAGQLERAIIGLADAGEMKLARDWLARALKEGAAWNIERIGAFSSAVFQSMAKAVARVEGREAALAILDIAEDRAKSATVSGWRTAALGSIAAFRVELNPSDAAEAIARAVRSPSRRRELLVKLFAKRQDWDKLHEALDTAKTPIQAADLIYSLKFIWRPQAD